MIKRKRHNFRELMVWKKARENNKRLYLISANFPDVEKYGLTSQLRRASVSIMTNIAEGAGRRTDKDFINFLGMAHGSATETENLIIISNDLGYLEEKILNEQIEYLSEIQKMLNGLMDKLEN